MSLDREVKMVEPVQKLKLFESVLKQLIETIKRGDYLPGEKLPREVDLAKQLNVSRNCVREALKTLTWFGVIESVSGQGTFVCANAIRRIENTELLRQFNDDSSLMDLLEVRLLLEAQTAFLAAQKATPDDIEELKQIVDKENALLKDEKNLLVRDLDTPTKFHSTVLRIARNELLVRLLNSISGEIGAQRQKYLRIPIEQWAQMMKNHELILKYIIEKNPRKASDAMFKDVLNGIVILGMDEENKLGLRESYEGLLSHMEDA